MNFSNCRIATPMSDFLVFTNSNAADQSREDFMLRLYFNYLFKLQFFSYFSGLCITRTSWALWSSSASRMTLSTTTASSWRNRNRLSMDWLKLLHYCWNIRDLHDDNQWPSSCLTCYHIPQIQNSNSITLITYKTTGKILKKNHKVNEVKTMILIHFYCLKFPFYLQLLS